MGAPQWRKLVACIAVALLSACASQSTNIRHAHVHAARPSAPQLPFGGRTILPGHRIVAYYGAAQTPDMGILGHAPPDEIAPRLLRQARAYVPYGSRVAPAFELIATIAQQSPGADGTYSMSTDAKTIARYLQAVRAFHGLLILDIQPGRGSFLREARRYEPFLRKPDVELALDSEWSMEPTQVPAEVIGGTTGAVVNGVSSYLSSLVRRYNLPQKLLVVHEFAPFMVEHRNSIVDPPNVAIVFHVDGFGSRAAKLSKYRILSQNRGKAFMGIKLFYTQDIDMFAASEVMKLRPQPALVTYQ